jgi:hypothetical protein
MSVRSTTIHVVSKAGISLGALFLVGVLLAAIPAPKLPPAQGFRLRGIPCRPAGSRQHGGHGQERRTRR